MRRSRVGPPPGPRRRHGRPPVRVRGRRGRQPWGRIGRRPCRVSALGHRRRDLDVGWRGGCGCGGCTAGRQRVHAQQRLERRGVSQLLHGLPCGHRYTLSSAASALCTWPRQTLCMVGPVGVSAPGSPLRGDRSRAAVPRECPTARLAPPQRSQAPGGQRPPGDMQVACQPPFKQSMLNAVQDDPLLLSECSHILHGTGRQEHRPKAGSHFPLEDRP